MNKTYLIINPFPESASHGIHNYNLNLLEYLKDKSNYNVDYYANNKKLPPEKFRKEVYKYVTQNYGIDDVIIEAPEVKASTLLLENYYNVHIRMHTPGAIAQKYDGVEIDNELFALELEVIHKSKSVSSPSYGLINELKTHLNRKDISIYKNPFNLPIEMSTKEDKKYDVIFMGRFQKLKGVEYINDILENFPEYYNVILLGNNSSKYKLSPRIKCNVEIVEEISGIERFEYVKKSKVLMQLSKFENCSMVILESFACGTVVSAWDVGGNSEIADNKILKIIKLGDTASFAKTVMDVIDRFNDYPSQIVFKRALTEIQEDFENGIKSIINGEKSVYKGLNKKNKPISFHKNQKKEVVSHDYLYKQFGERIFGFSLSNEQIEEMWIPIIDKFNSDYRFVCRRPLGFMYKFNNPFYVDPSKFIRFDWIRYPNLLLEEIEKFKPHKIFFHNGIHPMYSDVLNRLRKRFPNIPIVYSELGWFPQQDHIYFDEWGTNGMSKIASLSFEEFCNTAYPENDTDKKVVGEYSLIITQLENDTNLIVNSKRFKSMENFIEYIISELPDEKFIIKTHPLDNEKERFEKFESKRIKVVHEADMSKLIEKSKAVLGVNSTVLLEALKYDVNVYMFGEYLLSNKKVVIECGLNDSLKNLWTDKYHSSRKAKDLIIKEFTERQINVRNLKDIPLSDLLESKAFRPLLYDVAKYDNKIEFDYVKSKLNNRIDQTLMANNKLLREIKSYYEKNNLTSENITAPRKNNTKRKFKKLISNPKKFFADSRLSFFRLIGKLL